jgi:uncharacterized protein (DUF697 family)
LAPPGRAIAFTTAGELSTLVVGFDHIQGRAKGSAYHRAKGSAYDRKGTPMTDTNDAPGKPDEQGAAPATMPKTTDASSTDSTELASKLVNRFAVWSGVAGLIPLPVVDVVAIGGLQLQMLRRISQLYGVPFSENRGKALIASLGGALIPASSGIGAASALKAVPVFGTIASGIVMPVLSAGATYAIGKAFIQHFASGGTLLDFNPPDYREFVRAQKEMWDSKAKGPTPSGQAPADHAENARATAGT